jgi:transposase
MSQQWDGKRAEPIPDPEVEPKAQRRQFSAEYKRRILQEYEACTKLGEKGALLRREGLYSSNLTNWRRQGERGELAGLASKKPGPKSDPQAEEIARLKRENAALRKRLEQAELIIEVQKKVSQILGLSVKQDEPDEAS